MGLDTRTLEDPKLVPVLEQPVDDGRADEPATAADGDLHAGTRKKTAAAGRTYRPNAVTSSQGRSTCIS